MGMVRLISVLLFFALIATAHAKPNIIVIMTDDMALRDMGDSVALGRPIMPNVRALLEAQGATFTNAFNDDPLCCPSRATWITGQAQHNHGVLGTTPAQSGGYLALKPTEGNTLPVWLQAAGYRTGHIGKHLIGYTDPAQNQHVPPGWDNWQATAVHGYFNWVLNDNGTLVPYGSAPVDYQTDVLSRLANAFVSASDSRPYFLMVAPWAPHADNTRPNPRAAATPAPRHAGMFAAEPLPQSPVYNQDQATLDLYKPPFIRALPMTVTSENETLFRSRLESLQAVDDLVGSLVAAVTASGKLANTIFVFTSDNGFIIGDHRWVGKALAYDPSIRIPLVIRGPGVPVGVKTQMVMNYDVVATIVGWAGATAGRTFDGKTMAQIFAGAPGWRSAILTQGLQNGAQVSLRWYSVRTSRMKYIWHEDGFEELYDLTPDPYERVNKVSNPNYQTTLVIMRAMLARLKACVGINCWVH